MQVNSNINAMVQLEKRLEESANELAKLNQNPEIQVNDTLNQPLEKVDLVHEMVEQIAIPLSYNANAEVFTTQDAMYRTVLDITV